jgi:hypothetical protein
VVVDLSGVVRSVFDATYFFDAEKAAAKIDGGQIETCHGFRPDVGSIFTKRCR